MAADASTRTAGDIGDAALRLIGVLYADQTAPASDANLALDALAEMVAGWSGEGLLVPAITQETFALVIGQAAYTVGPTGVALDTVKPEQVYSVYIRDTNVDYYCQIIGEGQYAEKADKGTAQARPTEVWINFGGENTTFTFWKEPDATDTVIYTCAEQITEPTAVDDLLVNGCGIPRSYHNALKFNLAVELAPYYGKEAPMTVLRAADRLKLAIISQNAKNRREPIEPAYWQRMLTIMGMQIGQ